MRKLLILTALLIFVTLLRGQDDGRGPEKEPKKVTLTIFRPEVKEVKITSFSINPNGGCIAYSQEKKRSIFCGSFLVTMEYE